MNEISSDVGIIEISNVADEILLTEAETLLEAAGTNVSMQGDAVNTICIMLSELNDLGKTELFSTYLARKYKLTKKAFNSKIKELSDSSKSSRFRKRTNNFRDDNEVDDPTKRLGWFASENNCYYFYVKEGPPVKGSNFIIKPLFHIYSKSDNKRLIEIENEYGLNKILDIPSKCLMSYEQFQQFVYSEGNFIFSGRKQQYMKILQHI